MVEIPMHRETVFGAWVERVGVTHIVLALARLGQNHEVTPAAVYQWWRREHVPRHARIRSLVRVADGAITLQDVYDHFAPAAAPMEDTHARV
jgi:hypothetical protein